MIGAKFERAGQLDDGFAGTLAATAPGLGQGDCRAAVATLYGAVWVEDGKPGFKGPVRLREVACAGAQLARADVAAELTMAKDFAEIEGDFGLDSGSLGYADTQVAGLSGAVDLRWRMEGSNLTVRHDLTGPGVATPLGRLGTLGAEGDLRLADNLARTEWTARISGEAIDLALADGSALAVSVQSKGTASWANWRRGIEDVMSRNLLSIRSRLWGIESAERCCSLPDHKGPKLWKLRNRRLGRADRLLEAVAGHGHLDDSIRAQRAGDDVTVVVHHLHQLVAITGRQADARDVHAHAIGSVPV